MTDFAAELTLKHEVLDAQHAEIFRNLAAVAETLRGPAATAEAAVATLADSLVTHLATEEQIMDDALYPERVRHKSAHELFMADFLQMRTTLREEGPTPAVVDWITRRIPEWLRFHISVNDYPLSLYLARRKMLPGAGLPAQSGSRRPS
jgi:hemerythrin